LRQQYQFLNRLSQGNLARHTFRHAPSVIFSCHRCDTPICIARM
jgi:hypothetical protein